MATTTVTRSKHALRPSLAWGEKDRAYQNAWKRFWQVSARLNKLWKTKKDSSQILREERAR